MNIIDHIFDERSKRGIEDASDDVYTAILTNVDTEKVYLQDEKGNVDSPPFHPGMKDVFVEMDSTKHPADLTPVVEDDDGKLSLQKLPHPSAPQGYQDSAPFNDKAPEEAQGIRVPLRRFQGLARRSHPTASGREHRVARVASHRGKHSDASTMPPPPPRPVLSSSTPLSRRR